jgi:hypothetical protein
MPSNSRSDRGRKKESRKRARRDKDEDDDRDRESRRHHKSSRKSRSEDDNKKHSRKSHRHKKRERPLSSDESGDGSRRHKSSKHDRKRSSRDESRSSRREKEKKTESSSSHKEPSKIPSKLVDIGPVEGFPPKSLLDPDKDYFAYHEHLRLYLYRSEGKYFEDLSSSETHKAFAKFCAKYNRGGLEKGFYQMEMPQDALEQCKRTKHSWNFKTSAAEIKSLDVIKSGVKKQTSYDVKPSSNTVKGPMICAPASDRVESSNRAGVLPRKDELEFQRLASSIDQDKRKLSQQEAVLMSSGLGGLKPGQQIKIAPREM